MTKKKIIVSRIEVNWYSSFQDRRHNSVRRRLHMLHRKCIKHCAIAVFISLIGSVNSLPNSRKIEPVDKIHRVRRIVTVVFDIINTETWSVRG